ncbi:MAG: methyltransferase domain-containing protein [Candidatus Pacebacteria bacterium]|nr:methyltransferase domain-containing protein [Candidatus Paceibacterota bacterium]
MNNQKTSWSNIAGWYDELLKGESTYQKDLILPNLLRLMEIKKGEIVLDLACGQGFFAREFNKNGAHVIGADISKKLIEIAKKDSPQEIKYEIAPADNLKFLLSKSVNKITIILAIQNIENIGGVFKECARVLKEGGRLFLVVNHPAFRVPKQSGWGWDEQSKIQYRRIEEYLSESKVKILMHPGDKEGENTISFHRPLQVYFKALEKSGLRVSCLEEWNSNKKSQPGPRAAAENKARKEFPLFLFIEAVSI